VVIDPAGAPVLSYPARGWGGLLAQSESAVGSLSALVGATWARLLENLGEPASTIQLARLHGLTPGAVSQYLGALSGAGLLSRARFGHSVHYKRTPSAMHPSTCAIRGADSCS
jgi:DNA-binding transcriptional ArsR family regulator